MNLAQLQALNALAEHKSFQNAAFALNITQSAVSKRLAALDAQFGTKLFRKQGRNTELSEIGECVLKNAMQIEQQWKQLHHEVAELQSGNGGVLRLAASHYVGSYYLAPLAASLFDQQDSGNLKISLVESATAIDMLSRAEVDLALCTAEIEAPAHLRQRSIIDEKLYVAVAKNHELNHRKDLTVGELRGYSCILPPSSALLQRQLTTLFGEYPQLSIVSRSNQISSISAMVNASLGWGLLPKRAIADQSVALTQLPFTHRRICAFIDANRSEKVAASRLLSRLSACFESATTA